MNRLAPKPSEGMVKKTDSLMLESGQYIVIVKTGEEALVSHLTLTAAETILPNSKKLSLLKRLKGISSEKEILAVKIL